MTQPIRIICHSKFVIDRALRHGWQAGARYTNLRDVKHLSEVYFIDIDWQNYSFEKHLDAVRSTRPNLTVARDVIDATELDDILHEASVLSRYVEKVIVVPKDEKLSARTRLGIPDLFRLGYSVPTKYGGTPISPRLFKGGVHLLGGRPDVQRALANEMSVESLDGNRFTYDAKFGDYFTGDKFVPHPIGGYEECLHASLENIAKLWEEPDHG